MKSQGSKVYVGMSGGVDSSVSAALLKQQGFDVTGVFIKVWQPDWMTCTWREDRLDAMRVAAQLEIPFITLDLEVEYKREVIDYMISEYKAGRTPNPDVMCNSHVKFGAFYDWAMKNGADLVATGHYARSKDGKLFTGIDDGKDQSYFLWTLSKDKLSKVIFPVGDMPKSETRKLAKKFKLLVADKKDSQGLCFVGKIDVKEFLSHYIDRKVGNVLDDNGKIIGTHDGVFFLTIGERHGFTVTKKTPNDQPYYIVDKNINDNTVTVSHKSPEGALSAERKAFDISDVNWVDSIPMAGKSYTARVRHLGELLPCKVAVNTNAGARITFQAPLIVASGQSIVIYDKDECLGGGMVL